MLPLRGQTSMNLFLKRRLYRPFFVLLSLLLIGSQQAAFAHLLTHLRGGSTAVTHYQNDHDAIDQLADTCMTCIAFAGVVGSAPPSALSVSFASFTGNSYSLFSATPVFGRLVMVCRARDPPVACSR